MKIDYEYNNDEIRWCLDCVLDTKVFDRQLHLDSPNVWNVLDVSNMKYQIICAKSSVIFAAIKWIFYSQCLSMKH